MSDERDGDQENTGLDTAFEGSGAVWLSEGQINFSICCDLRAVRTRRRSSLSSLVDYQGCSRLLSK